MHKIIGCLFLALLTTACGWQLRGAANTSHNVSALYISATDTRSASATELLLELRKLLTANHVTLLSDNSMAIYTLNILEEKKDKRTVGVGSDALSSAYEITLKADYEIRTKNSAIFTKAVATSVRSFNYDTTSIGSAAQEEIILMKEMRRELAEQMLRRLNAVATHTPSSANNSESSNGKTAP